MQRTDSEIWQDILAGSQSAWRELINRYQALVYAVATRAGLSSADAADCFQQTWVRLYQGRKRIQEPSRLSAWLVTTAKREAIHLSQRAAGAREDSALTEPVDLSPLPDEELERLERQAQLEQALRQIDDRCQTLLRAMFFAPENQSYDEIAKSLGMSFNSLGPIRQRCLARLKKQLLANGFLPVRDAEGTTL